MICRYLGITLPERISSRFDFRFNRKLITVIALLERILYFRVWICSVKKLISLSHKYNTHCRSIHASYVRKEGFLVMQNRSENDYLPQVMSLNPTELINWCRNRKKFLGISNQKIAEQTGVPVGTVDRIMAGKYTEFRYSSIQPLVALLIGIREDTPKPENADAQQVQDYYDTIEGYKLVVENKNHMIEELKIAFEQLGKEVEYLKTENERKHQAIVRQQEHVSWLEGIIDDYRKQG